VREKNKKLFSQIDKYERQGLTSGEEALLFTELVTSGMVWCLKGARGHYAVRAMELIAQGVIEEPMGLKVLGNHDYRAMQDVDVSGD